LGVAELFIFALELFTFYEAAALVLVEKE